MQGARDNYIAIDNFNYTMWQFNLLFMDHAIQIYVGENQWKVMVLEVFLYAALLYQVTTNSKINVGSGCIINWLRCRLSFALLRHAILCIRGSRSSAQHSVLGPLNLSVVLAESRLTN